jgi:hypothetical protein
VIAKRIVCPAAGQSVWAGYESYILVSPDARHEVELPYVSEPPHGDSYHTIQVDGHSVPGFAWGCNFAWSDDSRYLVLSWMRSKWERKTLVIDVELRRYVALPAYFYDFRLRYPAICEVRAGEIQSVYTFSGDEAWAGY